MMKRFLIVLFTAFVFAQLNITAFADTYFDDCSGSVSGSESYKSNFSSIPQGYLQSTGWLEAPDNTALAMKYNTEPAIALYQISGASKVIVDLYSRNGTFATIDSANQAMSFGLSGTDSGQSKIPLYINTQTNSVYAKYQENDYRMVLNQKSSKFEFLSQPASGQDLLPYGLAVYAFNEDGTPRLLDAKRTFVFGSDPNKYSISKGCFERFSATVPSETKAVGIFLYDFSKIETTQGAIVKTSAGNSLCLAAVKIEGNKLVIGLPQQQSSSQSSSSKAESKTKDKPIKAEKDKESSSKSSQSKDNQKPAQSSSVSSVYEQDEPSHTESSREVTAQTYINAVQSSHTAQNNLSGAKITAVIMLIIGSAFLCWKIIGIFFLKSIDK